MNIRERLWRYCPRPVKRTGPYILRAYAGIQKEMVPGRFMKWLAIVGYIAFLLFTWLDYFIKLTGYATLEGALLYTILVPLITYAGFKIYKIKSLKFWQWEWTVGFGAIFGFAIWSAITFLLNRVLSVSEWAGTPGVLFTYTMLAYAIGVYAAYRVGKRRQFRPIGVLV
jgi:hypothetical protein